MICVLQEFIPINDQSSLWELRSVRRVVWKHSGKPDQLPVITQIPVPKDYARGRLVCTINNMEVDPIDFDLRLAPLKITREQIVSVVLSGQT